MKKTATKLAIKRLTVAQLDCSGARKTASYAAGCSGSCNSCGDCDSHLLTCLTLETVQETCLAVPG